MPNDNKTTTSWYMKIISTLIAAALVFLAGMAWNISGDIKVLATRIGGVETGLTAVSTQLEKQTLAASANALANERQAVQIDNLEKQITGCVDKIDWIVEEIR